MKTLLELDGVARHGPVEALRNVSLVVREGEVVAVLSASGTGKTTTLRTYRAPSRGRAQSSSREAAQGGPEAAARAGVARAGGAGPST